MGVYRAAIITESGQNLIAQAIAGAGQIQFSHAKTSSYAYPASTNIQGLTDLQDIKQTAVPFSAKVFDDTVVQVSVRFENTEVSEAYLIQTIGLYAQIGDSAEILFSVVQANTPDQMPVESSVSPSAFIYNIQSTVQQATQISVTVNPAGTATVQDVLDIENPEFDDSGIVESITGFPQFMGKFKSKMNLFQWFRDFKAGAQFLLHVGSIVNNCVSSDTDKPLAAAQGKVLMDMVNQLNSRYLNNAGSHNSIYRGKNIGTSVTAAQYAAIKAGTFDDLYIGDYWVINGVTWRIAAFDYYLRCGDSELTTHHAVIVPDSALYNHVMNDTNTTDGGYVGSKMYTEGLESAKTTIKAAFSGHVLSHKIYLTNAVANGRPSAGSWFASEVDLMCEEMVYGCGIFRPTSDGSNVPANYRVEKSQLPLFAHRPDLISNRIAYWLRDVVTAADFARAYYDGAATYDGASNSRGVRPAFLIY